MKRTQRGFSLISMAIAVIIAGLLAVAGFRALQYMQERNTAENLANGLVTSDKAVSTYATKYYSQLVNHQPICAASGNPCVANTLAPTSAEFQSLGILPANFQSTAYTGGHWKFQVSLTPAGCTPTTCDISWLSYLDTSPKNSSGKVDLPVVGDAAQASGLTAGFSTSNNPGTLYGLKGAWNAPNPVGPVPGILAASGSYNSSALAGFLLRNGTLPMTGNLDTGGNSIVNVGNGSQFNSDQGGSIELGGNNTTAGSGTPYIDFHLAGQGVQDFNVRLINDSNNNLSVVGTTGNANLTVGGVTATGTVSAGALATPGQACSPNGQIADAYDSSGLMLSCQQGIWKPLGGNAVRLGYTVFTGGQLTVPAPSCPAGGSVLAVPILLHFSVDPTATVNVNVNQVGPNYVLTVTDGATPTPAVYTSASGLLEFYCSYL